MALFKPFRGNRADLDAVEKHDGYAYFCVDDGSFHIDYVDADGNLQRKQISDTALAAAAVAHTKQTLTDEQKARARENIGAAKRMVATAPTTVSSVADDYGNHCVTLSGVDIGERLTVKRYDDDGNEISPTNKVFCYDGGNLFPMSELVSSTSALILGDDFEANGISLTDDEKNVEDFNLSDCISVTGTGTTTSKGCIIDLPCMYPAGYYYISARIVRKHDDAPNVTVRLYNTTTKEWALTGGALGPGLIGSTGRHGYGKVITVPFNRIIIDTGKDSVTSSVYTTIMEKFQVWYSPISLGNEPSKYMYKGDYCGVVYDVSTETPEVTSDPMVMFVDDFGAYDVAYKVPAEADLPSVTTDDNGKVLQIIDGMPQWVRSNVVTITDDGAGNVEILYA